MITKDVIRESNVAQGDLAFINIKTNSFKTGWWRKIKCGACNAKPILYVLELPLYKDFADLDIKNGNTMFTDVSTFIQNGFYVMTNTCVYRGVNANVYEIMADARGTVAGMIATNYYSKNHDKLLPSTISDNEAIENDMDSIIYHNLTITRRFQSLIQYYQHKDSKSDLQELANHLI